MLDLILEKAIRKNSILQCGLKKAKENPNSDWGFITDITIIQFGNEIKGAELTANEKQSLSEMLKDAFIYLASKGVV